MICDKCKNVKKSYEIDRFGNISILWTCTVRYLNVYSQINYDSFFLSRLKSGKFYKDEVDFSSMIPTNKKLSDLEPIEVIFERKIEKCKNRKVSGEGLDRFL